MRILLVTTESFLTSGAGIATYTEHAVTAHLAAGNTVHLLAVNREDAPVRPFQHERFRLTNVSKSDLEEAAGRSRCANHKYDTSMHLTDRVRAILAQETIDIIETQDYLAPLHHAVFLKRSGHFPECPPIIVFGHGMTRCFYPSLAVFPSESELRVQLAEQQQAEFADLFLAPSELYAGVLRRELRRSGHIRVVREPRSQAERKPPRGRGGRVCHLGRVSHGKGADLVVYAANSMRPYWPIEAIRFVGTVVPGSFRFKDYREQLTRKLHPELRNKVEFLGALPREEAIREVGSCHLHANFSRFETFSYAQLESIMQGVAPLVLEDSAMAEFIPPSLREGVLTHRDFDSADFRRVLEFWMDPPAGEGRMRELQEHAAALCCPEKFAADYARTVEELVRTPATRTRPPAKFRGTDTTVIISCHNDGKLLRGAVESVKAQEEPVAEIVVFDDGSHQEEHHRILADLEATRAIRLIRSTNIGLVAARQRLVEAARTPFVTFLDADDRLSPNFVSTLLHTLNTHPGADAVIPYRRNFGSNQDLVTDHPLGTPYHWAFSEYRMTSLLRREVALKLGFPYLMKEDGADDWYFWLRFSAHGFSAELCPVAVFDYAFHEGSMTWPWSEGQAATSSMWRRRIIEEAAAIGVELLPICRLLEEAHSARHYDSIRGRGNKADAALAKGLLDSKWLALGTILGQAAPLRRALEDPIANADQLRAHIRQSRWMQLGRRLGVRFEE